MNRMKQRCAITSLCTHMQRGPLETRARPWVQVVCISPYMSTRGGACITCTSAVLLRYFAQTRSDGQWIPQYGLGLWCVRRYFGCLSAPRMAVHASPASVLGALHHTSLCIHTQRRPVEPTARPRDFVVCLSCWLSAPRVAVHESMICSYITLHKHAAGASGHASMALGLFGV